MLCAGGGLVAAVVCLVGGAGDDDLPLELPPLGISFQTTIIFIYINSRTFHLYKKVHPNFHASKVVLVIHQKIVYTN